MAILDIHQEILNTAQNLINKNGRQIEHLLTFPYSDTCILVIPENKPLLLQLARKDVGYPPKIGTCLYLGTFYRMGVFSDDKRYRLDIPDGQFGEDNWTDTNISQQEALDLLHNVKKVILPPNAQDRFKTGVSARKSNFDLVESAASQLLRSLRRF